MSACRRRMSQIAGRRPTVAATWNQRSTSDGRLFANTSHAAPLYSLLRAGSPATPRTPAGAWRPFAADLGGPPAPGQHVRCVHAPHVLPCNQVVPYEHVPRAPEGLAGPQRVTTLLGDGAAALRHVFQQ